MPKLSVDWSINLGSILTLGTMVIGGIATYYQIVEQVKTNTSSVIVMQGTIKEDRQKQDDVDKKQDEAREKLANEVKQALKDQRDDIRQEFRDLRSDLRKVR